MIVTRVYLWANLGPKNVAVAVSVMSFVFILQHHQLQIYFHNLTQETCGMKVPEKREFHECESWLT